MAEDYNIDNAWTAAYDKGEELAGLAHYAVNAWSMEAHDKKKDLDRDLTMKETLKLWDTTFQDLIVNTYFDGEAPTSKEEETKLFALKRLLGYQQWTGMIRDHGTWDPALAGQLNGYLQDSMKGFAVSEFAIDVKERTYREGDEFKDRLTTWIDEKAEQYGTMAANNNKYFMEKVDDLADHRRGLPAKIFEAESDKRRAAASRGLEDVLEDAA
jgi:hypothetical protein